MLGADYYIHTGITKENHFNNIIMKVFHNRPKNITEMLDHTIARINRGGEKIFSIEVENVLYSHPKVMEASVVGVPDSVFGEQVKAVIVVNLG